MTPNHRSVVDPIHGAIRLTPDEWRVVDTPEFQRLRRIKQLQFAHLTYPNATHTRFAHCLGTRAIMERVTEQVGDQLGLRDDDISDLKLAALVHDIGHYPYSHLLEGIDKVVLTEELVGGESHEVDLGSVKYPNHEELGRIILEEREALSDIVGGADRAKRIAGFFTGTCPQEDMQLSKLIHSSLDMDRLDYLPRDAAACGVPFGAIDLHYLMNNFRVSESGMLGISEKASAAAEHFLLARLFMYRIVTFHKTTFGLEEACRQLLRRCRDSESHGVPGDGRAIRNLARSDDLLEFDDGFVDRIIQKAANDEDTITSTLAGCLVRRTPPKLLREESGFLGPEQREHNRCTSFYKRCEDRLAELAQRHQVPLGLFLLGNPKPVRLEVRGPEVLAAQAEQVEAEAMDELIKVFVRGEPEPKSLVDVPDSMISKMAGHTWRITRLYVVGQDDSVVQSLREAVSSW